MRSILFRVVPVFVVGLCVSATACGGQTIGGSPGGGSSSGATSSGGTTSSSGASSAGTASLSGTVAGVTFSVASELAWSQPAPSECSGGGSGGPDAEALDDGGSCAQSGQVLSVGLSNRGDSTCAALQQNVVQPQNVEYANLEALLLIVVSPNGTSAPGTYAIPGSTGTAGIQAGAQLDTTNASCAPAIHVSADGGSITLTAVSTTEVAGTYDVTFGSQGSYSGTFDVPLCDVQSGGAGAGSNAGTVCE
ncbi:MAG TPA: hypothetical protein VIY73_16975 [Polyangiaceae bacterium]